MPLESSSWASASREELLEVVMLLAEQVTVLTSRIAAQDAQIAAQQTQIAELTEKLTAATVTSWTSSRQSSSDGF